MDGRTDGPTLIIEKLRFKNQQISGIDRETDTLIQIISEREEQ